MNNEVGAKIQVARAAVLALPKETQLALVRELVERLGKSAIMSVPPTGRAKMQGVLDVFQGLVPAAFRDLSSVCRGSGPHRAYEFTVAPSTGTVATELSNLLGAQEAQHLMAAWRSPIDFDYAVPHTSKMTLFVDSHHKARNKNFVTLQDCDTTTQQEYLLSAGYRFGCDLVATLLCARLVSTARKSGVDLATRPERLQGESVELFGLLPEGSQALLTKLRTGVVRTRHGALSINEKGELSAEVFHDEASSVHWAFGEEDSREIESL